MTREDVYIYPRAKALIERCGNMAAAARELAEHLGHGSDALRMQLQRTMKGDFVRSRPIGANWSLPWPYDLYRDRPCSESEFQVLLRDARKLVSTDGLHHRRPAEAFPSPETQRHDSVVTDATGAQLGDEVPSDVLEPKYDETKEVPRDFEGILGGFKRAQAELHLHEAAQVRCRVDFRSSELPVGIMGMSDIHWGSQDVDYDAIGRHIGLLKAIPNLYGICAGDINEFAKTKHRNALDGQVLPPTVQARGARAMFLETYVKWLAACLGNHDTRIHSDSGFDIGEYIFGEVPEGARRIPFLRDGGLVVVELGAIVYTINVFHGDSSFGTRFNPNHKGAQVVRMVDGPTDIVMNGHTHNPAVQDTFAVSDDMQPLRDILLIQLGSYKVKGDDHARRRKFAEVSDVQMGCAILFPDVKRVLGFKRVEDAVVVLEAVTELYKQGGSIARYWPAEV